MKVPLLYNTRKLHIEHLSLAGEVVGETPTRVEKVGSSVKLPLKVYWEVRLSIVPLRNDRHRKRRDIKRVSFVQILSRKLRK